MAAPFDATPVWSTSCEDWEDRIVAGRPLVPCAPLFPDEAARGLEVFKSLVIADVPGKPTIGEVGREWSFDFVGAIFGAYNPDTERQMIREFLLTVSKKNAKSTLAAGIMMTVLILNPRHSAEFVILAPTKEIADNSFDPAADMADAINESNARQGKAALFRVYRREKRIVHLGMKSELKVVAADSDTVGGTKATVVLVDELWLFGKRAGAMSMFREATGGLMARPEGFVIYLTTMSDDVPVGVFREKLEYGRNVRDGRVDDKAFLPVIYEFPPRMLDAKEHKNPENFYITNPNLGASVDVETLVREYGKAEQAGEAELRDFLAKHLNVPIGAMVRSDRWVGGDHWEPAADPSITLESIIERCEVVVAGIDGGGLDDLLGLAVLGRKKITRRWLLWSKAWCHRTVLDRRKSEAPRLLDLEKAKDLVIVDDMEQAFAEVADTLAVVDAAGLLAFVGLDPMGVGAQVDALAVVGIGGDQDQSPKERVVGISQGWTLNGAIKTTEIKLASGSLKHAGQALMAWAVGNAKTEPKGNAITITKAVAGTAKIDPLMAAFNAVALMSKNPVAQAVESIHAILDRLSGQQTGAQQVQSGAQPPQVDDGTLIDHAILQDVKHPRFAEMKARFEAQLDAQDDEDLW